MKYFKRLIVSLMIGVFSATLYTSSASAAFNPNNLMDDAVMNDYNSLSAAAIDSFLNSFQYSCISSNSGFAAKLPTGYNQSSGYSYGNFATAGQVIYAAAQAYKINPKVLIVTLEKEQSLVTGRNGNTWCGNTTDPAAQKKYAGAMGYGCPDSGGSYGYSGISLYRRGATEVTSIPATCVNASGKAGFSQQIIRAAWLLKFSQERSIGHYNWAIIEGSWDNTDDLSSCYSGWMTQGTFKRCSNDTATYYDGWVTIDNTAVHLDSGATAALYRYTPHFHGNQNFVSLYEQWFGTTYAFVHSGINFAPVFDPTYYLANNSDVAAACNSSQQCAFNHFVSHGLYEGRQSSSSFSLFSYAYAYSDLRNTFGNNLTDYIVHYINSGRKENRIAVGTTTLQNPAVKLNGVDYSAVYDFDYYKNNNPDLANLAGKFNDSATLKHFVTYGMKEGRQAKDSFNVTTYRDNHSDLRWAIGTSLLPYYMHFINYGQSEGRVATGTPNFNPVTSYGGIDYASVYSYQTYMSTYPELQNIFGSKHDDTGALLNFINSDMNKGRVASTNFNVNYYRNRYTDLRAAFGNNLKPYYMHYISHGQSEGRIANTDYLGGTTVLNGKDYSAVYNFNTYETIHSDIKKVIGLNDIAALQHFVTYGMKEGRQAKDSFNVLVYKNRYADLRNAFGDYLPAYYMHYINYGQSEGRTAI